MAGAESDISEFSDSDPEVQQLLLLYKKKKAALAACESKADEKKKRREKLKAKLEALDVRCDAAGLPHDDKVKDLTEKDEGCVTTSQPEENLQKETLVIDLTGEDKDDSSSLHNHDTALKTKPQAFSTCKEMDPNEWTKGVVVTSKTLEKLQQDSQNDHIIDHDGSSPDASESLGQYPSTHTHGTPPKHKEEQSQPLPRFNLMAVNEDKMFGRQVHWSEEEVNDDLVEESPTKRSNIDHQVPYTSLSGQFSAKTSCNLQHLDRCTTSVTKRKHTNNQSDMMAAKRQRSNFEPTHDSGSYKGVTQTSNLSVGTVQDDGWLRKPGKKMIKSTLYRSKQTLKQSSAKATNIASQEKLVVTSPEVISHVNPVHERSQQPKLEIQVEQMTALTPTHVGVCSASGHIGEGPEEALPQVSQHQLHEENDAVSEIELSHESQPVEEDIFSLEREKEQIRVKDPEPERPVYEDAQIFLAQNLLERIKHIMGNDEMLTPKYNKFVFRIYTARALQLQSQTSNRLRKLGAECFSKEVTMCDDAFREAAKNSVYTYSLRYVKDHNELMKNAEDNPKTLFLIIADEAHWGPTNKESAEVPEKDCDAQPSTSVNRAYEELINSWTDEKQPNVLILQVSATPENLLTKNTRLKLRVPCMFEEKDGIRSLRLIEEKEDNPAKMLQLHHMKWDECSDHSFKLGLLQELMVTYEQKGKSDVCNGYLHVDEDGMLSSHDKPSKLLFKGKSREQVRIQTSHLGIMKTLVVPEYDNAKESLKRRKHQVKFFSPGELKQFPEELYHFRVIPQGNDVFFLETTSRKFMLKFEGDETGTVFAHGAAMGRKSTGSDCRNEDCFKVTSSQIAGKSQTSKEYISLNFLFNSIAEDEKYDQYFREDDEFLDLCNFVNKNMSTKQLAKGPTYDILTADYAIHVLHINAIRRCTLQKRNEDEILNDLPSLLGEYTERRDNLIDEFTDALKKKHSEPKRKGQKKRKMTYERIKPELFKCVLDGIEDRTRRQFEESCKRFLDDEDTEMDVCSYLVNCLLFMRKEALISLQSQLQRLKKTYPSANFSKVFTAFEKDLNFEEQKKLRIAENETCRLIQDLVTENSNNILDGPMKIVRMNIKSGDKMYATLCLARKMSSENYSFEILRDYGTYRISDVHEKTNRASYRIHQLLQRDKCDQKDCNCVAWQFSTDELANELICLKCNHRHTKVNDYEDLKRIPVLLIIVEKGRMGDTFPDNFNVMDLRASSEDRANPVLSTLKQELGRCCRYVDKSKKHTIPYALLGNKLAETMMKKCVIHGTFSSGYTDAKKDAYIDSGNKANRKHCDYHNNEKHSNRILFEAEPQIGKTGVFLCLISLLRKLIEETEEEEFEALSPQTDEEEIKGDDIGRNMNETTEKWKRPFYKEIDCQDGLPKLITSGKYVSLVGPYCFGETRNLNERPIQNIQSKKSRQRCVKDNAPEFRAYSKCMRHSLSSRVHAEPKLYELSVDNKKIKISVPELSRFDPLLQVLRLGKTQTVMPQLQEKHETLKTWIFTPSYGRSKRAYLNLDQAMIDADGKPVDYIQVVVVRPGEEYESYVREWGSVLAVVCLPNTLSQAENTGPENGGVGYSKLFIQMMAKEFYIPTVFMLDDNILSVSKVKSIKERGVEVIHQVNGKHTLTNVPLFSCLQDLEGQIYGSKDPPPREPHPFKAYAGTVENTQESYTGPWAEYGIIGVLRNSPYVPQYKEPFKKTHVMAAVLVNMSALLKKKLQYKPWPVWEDLHMNNECDMAHLRVVKYNRWVIHKVHMSDWLLKVMLSCQNMGQDKNIPQQNLAENEGSLRDILQEMQPLELVSNGNQAVDEGCRHPSGITVKCRASASSVVLEQESEKSITLVKPAVTNDTVTDSTPANPIPREPGIEELQSMTVVEPIEEALLHLKNASIEAIRIGLDAPLIVTILEEAVQRMKQNTMQFYKMVVPFPGQPDGDGPAIQEHRQTDLSNRPKKSIKSKGKSPKQQLSYSSAKPRKPKPSAVTSIKVKPGNKTVVKHSSKAQRLQSTSSVLPCQTQATVKKISRLHPIFATKDNMPQVLKAQQAIKRAKSLAKTNTKLHTSKETHEPACKVPKIAQKRPKRKASWRSKHGVPDWISMSEEDSEFDEDVIKTSRTHNRNFTDAEVKAMFVAALPYKEGLMATFKDNKDAKKCIQALSDAVNKVNKQNNASLRHRWKIWKKMTDLRSKTKSKVQKAPETGTSIHLSVSEQECYNYYGSVWMRSTRNAAPT